MFNSQNVFELPDHALSPFSAHFAGWDDERPYDGRFKNQISRTALIGLYIELPNFWQCDSSGEPILTNYNQHGLTRNNKCKFTNINSPNSHYTQDMALGKQLRFIK